MKIGIDLSILNVNQAGTATYVNNLAKALKIVDNENDYLFFAVKHYHSMSRHKTFRTRMETIYRDLLWTHGVLSYKTLLAKVDILHMPANIIPIVTSCPTIVTLHDTIILKETQIFPIWQRNYFRVFMPLSAKRSSHILTNSKHSKHDICKYLNIIPDKVTVTYLASSPDFKQISDMEISKIRQKYNLGSYILTVGALEPRKNINRLLEAFALLRERRLPYQLIHVGPKGWFYDEVFSNVYRLQLQDSVRFLGKVDLDDLVGLYNAASVFVFPSLYEGFGLPVLEAMACGCPVVTSKLSSLPEVVGDAGLTINPYDVQQLAKTIQQVLEDEALAKDMRQRGVERSKMFSWKRCAEETLNVYRQVLGL